MSAPVFPEIWKTFCGEAYSSFFMAKYYHLLNYNNISAIRHKPFHKFNGILIYSKGFFLRQSDYWSKTYFLYYPYLAIPELIINNNRDIIDFSSRFRIALVFPLYRKKQNRNKEY
jgi:hypothetical protein